MSWIKLGLVIFVLLIWTASASAGEIDRSTDTQGTVHITTPKTDKTGDKTAITPPGATDKPVIKPHEKSGEPDRLDWKSHRQSRRPMNLSNPDGTPRKVRPSPYSNPPPAQPAPGTPGPEGVDQAPAR